MEGRTGLPRERALRLRLDARSARSTRCPARLRRDRAHRASRFPFDFTPEQWAATRELLLAAKRAWDERLAPDGYTLIWNCGPCGGQEVPHAHLHVIPRFDDEPLAGAGGRSAIKVPENVRPDPLAPGSGRARSLGQG